MNRIFKLTYLALVAVLVLALNACTSDFSYDGAGSDDSLASYGNIYFPTKSYSVELDPNDPTTYAIEIMREDATSAVTVPVTVEGDGASVVTAASAEFAADQTETTVTLSFPNAEIGTTYTVTLGAEGAIYLSPCTFSFTRVKWNDVGYYYDSKGNKVEGWCNYTEDFLTTFFGISNYTYPVKVQERDDKPGYYRIVNVYGATCPFLGEEDYDSTQDSYLYIDATDPDKVYIPSACNTHADVGYGTIYLHSMAGYYIADGETENAEGYYGTLKNGKITFPEKSLLICMYDYSTSYYYANYNSAFCLALDPDKDPYQADIMEDFDFDEVFTGIYSSGLLGSEGTATLMKGVCTTTKDDCDSVFAATYGEAYAIAYPYVDDYPIYFGAKDGKITLPVTEPQATGMTALNEEVYVTINAGSSSFTDKVVTLNMTFTNKDGSITYGTSNEVLSNITWTKVGAAGKYHYLSSMWSIGSESGLELYKRDDSENTYKIANWLMGSSDFVFTWDKNTNECVVPSQYTGYTHPNYGDMYIMELNQYTSDTASEPSSYYDPDTKTFHFNIIYYVSAGYFAYGFETFELDAAIAAKARKSEQAATGSMKSVTLKKSMKRTYKLKGVNGRFSVMKDVGNAKLQ